MKALVVTSLFLFLYSIVSAQAPATWSQSSTYSQGDLVINGTTTYQASQDVPANTEITNTTYWSTLDSQVPTETPSGADSLTTPDASEVENLTVPDSNSSGTDDPDLPNAGSTDVVLRGISTAGYISSSSKLSGGFTISGGSMSVLATGKGGKEYLSTGSLQDTLNNPSMSLLSLGNSTPLHTNADWSTGSHVSELTATNFFANYESDDSGLYVTLAAGSYLADISSSDGDAGGSLVEVYNNYQYFDNTYADAKLTGISTNGIVNNGTEPGQRMSAAVTIGNTAGTTASTKRIIIMAKYSLGVTSDHLEDPKLEVRDSSGSVIASNDDWSSNAASVKTAITTTGLMNGYRDKDAAIILSVNSGSYFVDVYSQDGDSGGALVEVYDLDLLESIYGWNLGN
ncbi:MAG: hypothetical protein VX153_01155 [Verrucomicrobiota bacterium]|nr:hypothetical protein [Verrucomicrobiota bacterium]